MESLIICLHRNVNNSKFINTNSPLKFDQHPPLRWMSGVTKLNIIRNERIRGTTKVGEISKKVQESRLKWYGHVLRRRIRREDSDEDGGAGEKEEMKTKAEVVG